MADVLVSILMGSHADMPIMKETSNELNDFGISNRLNVFWAHRTPKECCEHAALLATRILSLADEDLDRKLVEFPEKNREEILNLNK